MAIGSPEIGHVITATTTSGSTLLNPRLLIETTAGLVEWHEFEDPYWRCSPEKFREYLKYQYESLTGEMVHEADYYRVFWDLKMEFGDDDEWRKVLLKIQAGMKRPGLSFNSTGLGRKKRFYFQPYGDATRPTVEVVLNPGDIDDVEFWGGKYMGYADHTIRLWGAEKLYEPYLPLVILTPPGVGSVGGYTSIETEHKVM